MKRTKVLQSRRTQIHQIQSADGTLHLSDADGLELSETLIQMSTILFQLFQEHLNNNNGYNSNQNSTGIRKERE